MSKNKNEFSALSPQERTTVIASARDGLMKSTSTTRTTELLLMLLKLQDNEANSLVVEWLAENPQSDIAEMFLCDAISQGLNCLPAIKSWCASNSDHPSFNNVIQTAAVLSKDRIKTCEWLETWVLENVSHPSAFRAVTLLLEHNSDRAEPLHRISELQALARDWLRTSPGEDNGDIRLLSALLSSGIDPLTSKLLNDWLKSNGTSVSAGGVLLALIRSGHEVQYRPVIGLWLDHHSNTTLGTAILSSLQSPFHRE